MKRWKLAILLNLLSLGSVFSATAPMGRINGVAVFESELSRMPKEGDELSAFDRLVLFRLAIEQAKKEKLDQNPEVKHEMDLVLYKQFLNHRVKSEAQKLQATNEELKVYYEQQPLLRLRHLVFRFNNALEKEKALSKAAKVEALFGAGQSFSSVAEQLSEDETASIGGDIGERGPHNLHEDFYNQLLALQKGQISTRIESHTGIHYFQVVSRTAFESAPANYISFLTKTLSEGRQRRFLSGVLSELKQGARIEDLRATRNE